MLTGKWVAQDAGIGAGVDSYFEYLVKGAILLQDQKLMAMFLGKKGQAKGLSSRFSPVDFWPIYKFHIVPKHPQDQFTLPESAFRPTVDSALSILMPRVQLNGAVSEHA